MWKALPFSEPKQPTAEKAGLEGEGEVGLRSPGQIRDERDEGFQETCCTCKDSKKSPMGIRGGDNGIYGRPPLRRSDKKLRKPNRRPQKRNSDTKIAQAQRETKKINRASPTKFSPVTTAPTNNCGSPTGNLESPTSTKKLPMPDAK